MRLGVFKKRYLLYAALGVYVMFNNSCLTMRTSTKEANQFFADKKVSYTDSTMQVQNRTVHYIQTGQENAPTLVFVHGSPGSWNAYENYLTDSVLLKKFRIIALDRPGFGYSNFRKSMGLAAQAKILNSMLTELSNEQPYTLIGHSYGGPLIVQMAVDQSELYDNLVILAGALDPEAEKRERWRYPFRYFPLKYLVPGALRPSNDELILLKTDLFELKEKLHTLSQNVLIIHGTDDDLVPYSNVPFMEKEFTAVKSLKLHTLEGQNHFFVWQKEVFVKESMLEWLNEVGGL